MKYPAHLHMNILPEYQKMGISTILISTFEEHMRDKGVWNTHMDFKQECKGCAILQ
jgi:hypothetical protein